MKSLTKTYEINAALDTVFNALTNEATIEEWSGTSAVMDTEPNGVFSLWGGNIHGHNIEVSPSRIEQKWMKSRWKAYSLVEITLEDMGSYTQVNVTQENIPELSFDEVAKDWDTYYFVPLTQYLETT